MKHGFVDLFAGAGGLSLGLEDAGLHGLLASDKWPDAMATHAANLGGLTTTKPIDELVEAAFAELNVPEADWVVGGPPCQGYSTVGRRDRDDSRNKLFLEFQRVVGLLQPAGFVLENVLGLKDMRFVEEVRKAFKGYKVSAFVLSAADFGVPQLRRRVVFVGHRDAYFQGPIPTHTPDNYVTVWDAIGDLPRLEPGEEATSYDQEPFTEFQTTMRKASTELQGHWASRHPARLVEAISHIPDGGNRTSIPENLQPKSGFHNSYSRLNSKAPAVAITSNMGKPSATRCVHPLQHRGLTAREGARLQSFPDSFHFAGSSGSQRLQIANAVPPLLANAIGCALLDADRWAEAPPAWRVGGSFALPPV